MKIFSFLFLITIVLYAEDLHFLTASKIGSYYKIVLGCVDKNIDVVTTHGSLENFKLLESTNFQYAIVQEDILYFLEQLNFIKVIDNDSFQYRGELFNLKRLDSYIETIVIVSNKSNKKINIEDLNGKVIAIGEIGTGSNITGNIIKSKLWKKGIKFRTIYYTSFKHATSLLDSGRVDYILFVQKLTEKLKTKLKKTNLNIVQFNNMKKVHKITGYKIMNEKALSNMYLNPLIIMKQPYTLNEKILECVNR